VVIARAADVPLDAADLLKRLVGEFGGKGGGRSELAQGGGLAIEPAKILAAARAILGAPA
jgi:alanyl-tRNA synthetase